MIIYNTTYQVADAVKDDFIAWLRSEYVPRATADRLLLVPQKRSLYGKLRKEPRKESVSTLEACAQCLDFLGEDPAIARGLTDAFARMLEKYKALHARR